MPGARTREPPWGSVERDPEGGPVALPGPGTVPGPAAECLYCDVGQVRWIMVFQVVPPNMVTASVMLPLPSPL